MEINWAAAILFLVLLIAIGTSGHWLLAFGILIVAALDIKYRWSRV